jgi:hypothetical protein
MRRKENRSAISSLKSAGTCRHSYGFVWIPMDSYGFVWIPMDS